MVHFFFVSSFLRGFYLFHVVCYVIPGYILTPGKVVKFFIINTDRVPLICLSFCKINVLHKRVPIFCKCVSVFYDFLLLKTNLYKEGESGRYEYFPGIPFLKILNKCLPHMNKKIQLHRNNASPCYMKYMPLDKFYVHTVCMIL